MNFRRIASLAALVFTFTGSGAKAYDGNTIAIMLGLSTYVREQCEHYKMDMRRVAAVADDAGMGDFDSIPQIVVQKTFKYESILKDMNSTSDQTCNFLWSKYGDNGSVLKDLMLRTQ